MQAQIPILGTEIIFKEQYPRKYHLPKHKRKIMIPEDADAETRISNLILSEVANIRKKGNTASVEQVAREIVSCCPPPDRQRQLLKFSEKTIYDLYQTRAETGYKQSSFEAAKKYVAINKNNYFERKISKRTFERNIRFLDFFKYDIVSGSQNTQNNIIISEIQEKKLEVIKNKSKKMFDIITKEKKQFEKLKKGTHATEMCIIAINKAIIRIIKSNRF